LGGNVLSQFRVEIDYPEQLLFLEQSGKVEADDFDTVGLVLDINSAGQPVVRAVSSAASVVTRRNILPGDVIVRIGSFGKTAHTLTEAAQELSGAVGERKHLYILRRGKPTNVTVVVSRIL
jgi:C-terminal processing protease CtpA/Prc